MRVSCPNCQSMQVIKRDVAKRMGGLVGTVGGAASGAAKAMAGAQVGSRVGLVAFGPVGATLGGFAGALLGGLLGATTGGVAGAKLGEVIDAQVLHNCECLRCGHRFSDPNADDAFDPGIFRA